MEEDTGNRWDGHDRRKGGWSMAREIIGTAIGCMPFVVMLIVWGSSVETRVTRHDTKIESLEKSNDAQDKRAEAIESAVTRKLERIENKLDRLVERQVPVPGAPLGLGITREPQRAGSWRDGRDVNR